jgi:hypothetical protein
MEKQEYTNSYQIQNYKNNDLVYNSTNNNLIQYKLMYKNENTDDKNFKSTVMGLEKLNQDMENLLKSLNVRVI